jgi:hypothetical protein
LKRHYRIAARGTVAIAVDGTSFEISHGHRAGTEEPEFVVICREIRRAVYPERRAACADHLHANSHRHLIAFVEAAITTGRRQDDVRIEQQVGIQSAAEHGYHRRNRIGH